MCREFTLMRIFDQKGLELIKVFCLTRYSKPKYSFIAFAFAGDSTITKLLPILKKICQPHLARLTS
jgi:hypothetical protein